MTTKNEATEIILAAIAGASGLPTHVQFDNEDWPPSGRPDKDDTWLRAVVRDTSSHQQTLGPVGARKWVRKAFLLVQVFTPAGKGTRAGELAAKIVSNVFEGTTQSGLDFNAAFIRSLGRDEQTGCYQHNVEIPFTYYETR